MNKNQLMKNMSQAYLLLSEKRKEEFSRILKRLLINLKKMVILFKKLTNLINRLGGFLFSMR